MLDMTTNTAPVPAWAETLQRGDMALFRFPCAEENPSEAPKSRTCLVLEVESRGGQLFIELAYGTSAETRANVGNEIRIATKDDMEAAGVRKATRVVCDRRIRVTPHHPGWDLNPRHPSPVVGRLSPQGLARMNAIRAKIHALRDIAAERRSARGRPFRVGKQPAHPISGHSFGQRCGAVASGKRSFIRSRLTGARERSSEAASCDTRHAGQSALTSTNAAKLDWR
jgi:hypothetical protein